MFTKRNILFALVGATAITGMSALMENRDGADARPVKDQSRVSGEAAIEAGSVPSQVVVVRDGKAAMLMTEASCDAHSWPNVPAGCLIVADGAERPGSVRTVTVEQQTLTGSTLARIPVTHVASQ